MFHISLVSLYCLGNPGFFYRKKNSCGLGGGVSRIGVKEGRKGTKKNFFNFFDRTWGMCGELTTQPNVRSMCGPVRHHCFRCDERLNKTEGSTRLVSRVDDCLFLIDKVKTN